MHKIISFHKNNKELTVSVDFEATVTTTSPSRMSPSFGAPPRPESKPTLLQVGSPSSPRSPPCPHEASSPRPVMVRSSSHRKIEPVQKFVRQGSIKSPRPMADMTAAISLSSISEDVLNALPMPAEDPLRKKQQGDHGHFTDHVSEESFHGDTEKENKGTTTAAAVAVATGNQQPPASPRADDLFEKRSAPRTHLSNKVSAPHLQDEENLYHNITYSNLQSTQGTLKYKKNGTKSLVIQHVRGFYCGINTLDFRVVYHEDQYYSLWNTMFYNVNPMPDVIKVNFRKEQLVAIFIGNKKSGGYSVEIAEVREENDGLVVYYKVRVPAPDEHVPKAESQPFHIVVIPKSDRPVYFQKVDF